MTVTASRDEPSDSASYAGPTGFDGTLTIQLSLAKTLAVEPTKCPIGDADRQVRPMTIMWRVRRT